MTFPTDQMNQIYSAPIWDSSAKAELVYHDGLGMRDFFCGIQIRGRRNRKSIFEERSVF